MTVPRVEAMRESSTPGSPHDLRLAEAADSGEVIEVILVLRGRIRRAADRRRWRIRSQTGRVVTFSGDWVVAVTPVARPGSR